MDAVNTNLRSTYATLTSESQNLGSRRNHVIILTKAPTIVYATPLVARVGTSSRDLMGSEVTPFLKHEVGLGREVLPSFRKQWSWPKAETNHLSVFHTERLHDTRIRRYCKTELPRYPSPEAIECIELLPQHSTISF